MRSRSVSVTRGASGTSRAAAACRWILPMRISRRSEARMVADRRARRSDDVDWPELSVERAPCLDAARMVDRVARAEIVEPVRHARMIATRKQIAWSTKPFARDRRLRLDPVEPALMK